MTRGFKVQGLGEIAIRCSNLEKMSTFYETTLGLEPLEGSRFAAIRFFRIAPGVAGHTVVLALFQAEPGQMSGDGPSSLHHLALSLPLVEQQHAKSWLTAQGVVWHEEVFAWIGWRGVFLTDPEGNTVELVAFDPALSVPPQREVG
jgi:catechol 2,3-dioxygenase-like lactoylglutathione lyase family enzyme